MSDSPANQTTLSESLQDYLKIILDLTNEKRVARIKDISLKKGVSMPSVTEAMRKLAGEGLIKYSAREYIELTSKGEKRAHHLANRHTFLNRFLVDVLSLDPSLATQEACALEHHLSPQTLERLILLYQYLSYCPRNDQSTIQNFRHCLELSESLAPEDTECRNCIFTGESPHFDDSEKRVHILLADMKSGQKGRITMLGPDYQMRRDIIAKGLMPGTEITMEFNDTEKNIFYVSLDNYRVEIAPEEARHMEIALNEATPNDSSENQE